MQVLGGTGVASRVHDGAGDQWGGGQEVGRKGFGFGVEECAEGWEVEGLLSTAVSAGLDGGWEMGEWGGMKVEEGVRKGGGKGECEIFHDIHPPVPSVLYLPHHTCSHQTHPPPTHHHTFSPCIHTLSLFYRCDRTGFVWSILFGGGLGWCTVTMGSDIGPVLRMKSW